MNGTRLNSAANDCDCAGYSKALDSADLRTSFKDKQTSEECSGKEYSIGGGDDGVRVGVVGRCWIRFKTKAGVERRLSHGRNDYRKSIATQEGSKCREKDDLSIVSLAEDAMTSLRY